jgi:hypothetical protein
MERHEKVIKDSHDYLVEASEKFKDALTKKVREMEKHVDSHDIMKESIEALAVTARERFRGFHHDSEASRRARNQRQTYHGRELEIVHADLLKSQEEWIQERKDLHEKIKNMEKESKELKAERDKFMDQVSAHAVRNYKRSQEQGEEKAKAAKLAQRITRNFVE